MVKYRNFNRIWMSIFHTIKSDGSLEADNSRFWGLGETKEQSVKGFEILKTCSCHPGFGAEFQYVKLWKVSSIHRRVVFRTQWPVFQIQLLLMKQNGLNSD